MATVPRYPPSRLAPEALPLSAASPLFARLRGRVHEVALRAPDAVVRGRDAGGDDTAARWRRFRLGGRELLFAQPLTLTPYASARACSARCRFCSETLRPLHPGRMAAALRPGADYFAGLRRALAALCGLPLSLSLSGLETSDDEDWMLRLLDVLAQAECEGLSVEERVLYSNGAGFARGRGAELLDALARLRLSWLELSRHHPDAGVNQAIMRFRDGEPVASDAAFAAVARTAAMRFPVKLVCIVQRGGVEDAEGVARYLAFARARGASAVIFRELSRLDAGYRQNTTWRYVESARVGIDALIAECLDAPRLAALTPLRLTEGYYFRNLVLRDADGLEVVFEASDYGAMHAHHDSGRVYKLVYYPNGHLCAGWEPDRDVLLRTRDAPALA